MARYSQTQAAPDVARAVQEYSRALDGRLLAGLAREKSDSGEAGERYRSLLLMQMLSRQDADLLSALGDQYFQGFCVREDKAKARKIFERAAEQGSTRSMYDLAWYYYERQELLQAIDYFNRCIDAQDRMDPDTIGKCRRCLGFCYANLPDPKVSQAIENLTIAADKYHDVHAARRLGLLYGEKDSRQFSTEKCLHYLEQAAHGGEMVAVRILGDYYCRGNSELGIQPNWARAEAILLPHAGDGDAAVLRLLGNLYMYGDANASIPSDYAKAQTFYEQYLALEYDANIEANLGCVYFQLDQHQKAGELLQKADRNGIMLYSDFLGALCEDGTLGAKDPEKALHYYERAFNAGMMNNAVTCSRYMSLLEQKRNYYKAYAVADYGLDKYNDSVFLYTKARLVLNDLVTGQISREQAAEMMEMYLYLPFTGSRSVQAHTMLGHYYLSTRDYHKAEDHYLQAFEKGESDAAVYLGWLYEAGGGAITADPDKAYAWFAKAAGAGSVLGRKELSCWKKSLFGGWKRIANIG